MTHNTSRGWEIKGLLLSFILHLVVVGFFVYWYTKPNVVILKQQVISMEISEPISESLPEPTPLKPIEPIKEPETLKDEVVTSKPEPAKIVKEVAEIPNKVEKTKSTSENLEPKAVQKTEPKEPIQSQSEYKKTNFGIIRDKVLSHLRYPSIAKEMGWKGMAKVKLTIDKNGNLVDVMLSESSGKSQLDSAALSAARAIAGSNLPVPSETTEITLPISFDLKDED